MYNTHTFPGIAIYGYSDHETDIAIEFASKNRSRTCITLTHFPVLPNMVTLITKQTSPLGFREYFVFCSPIRKETNLGTTRLGFSSKYASGDI